MKSFSKNKIYKEINDEITICPNKALKMINDLEEDFSDFSYLALIIKILCKNNNIDRAYDIYKKIPENFKKKRFVVPIFDNILNSSRMLGYDFFKKEILNKFRIDEEDIIKIFNEGNFKELFDIIRKNKIIMSKNIFSKNVVRLRNSVCKSCSNRLCKVKMSKETKEKLLDNIKSVYFNDDMNELIKLDKLIINNKFNVFIDGNNVIFFKDRKITLDSYKRLNVIYNKLINDGYNPLIFLHRRHKSNNTNKLNIFYTPYRMNDDWFFLWSSIKFSETLLLTNDNLKDHIFKIATNEHLNNELLNWINSYVIRYKFSENYKLLYPKNYNNIAQINNGYYHIPLIKNNWICIKHE